MKKGFIAEKNLGIVATVAVTFACACFALLSIPMIFLSFIMIGMSIFALVFSCDYSGWDAPSSKNEGKDSTINISVRPE